MATKSIIPVILFLSIFMLSCGKENMIIEDVSAQKALELINNGSVVVLDVRTEKEFAEGHIASATLIDFNSSSFVDKVNALDKSKTYVVHCRSGARSSAALKKMQGFSKIYHIKGGFLEWVENKLPTTK